MIRISTNTEDVGEGQVGAVAACLIPALHRRPDRASDDGEVEDPRDTPLVEDLIL